MNFLPILQLLQQRLPNLMAVYAFGSQVTGTADKNSDLDLAVLVAGYADVIELWDISSDLAELANCEVDLLDFRAATTVMQYQILTTGKCLYAIDSSVGIYEAMVLSQMTALNEARAGLVQDIREQGAVYGRN
ncbi:DNA polymerase subunit beta [Alishewanella aestuarii B11]|uniref:DNA polymerase subunit beta n=1 Tax=Alishewanella aestuarii B11 TaxID=1197174 RepID=J2IDA8_9ALTE|nr:nucleotidyltransferase domain-containing protein [Alishewanella aestuarii]EJI84664.1 DNA polymerase subunit beta [Alishewanella aestuarii B11]